MARVYPEHLPESVLNDPKRRAEKEVFEAFKFDKKNSAGSLQMVLLKGIGKPVIVTSKDIPQAAARKVLNDLLKKWA